MEELEGKRGGGCACGAVRFEVKEPFVAIGICHCMQCQKLSGGGANYVALAPKSALTLLKGSPAVFESKGDSGATVGRAFCTDCGTPLWSLPAHEPFLPIKLGALDENEDLTPVMHIYVKSAPDWHSLNDDLPKFAKMPPSAEATAQT